MNEPRFVPCPDCNGFAEIYDGVPCSECEGSGAIETDCEPITLGDLDIMHPLSKLVSAITRALYRA